MFIASRLLLVLGLIGAAVGLFFGAKGAMVAHEAVSEVNRKGGDAESLFHADRLDSALDKVRANVGADGKLLELTVYPGYLMVEASTGSEDEGQAFKVQGNGDVKKLPLALTGPGRLEDNTFELAKLDAKAVAQLAGAVAAEEHATLDDVSHIVAMIEPDSGKPGLNVYLKNSKYWRAALDGSALSNPDQDARKALDKAAAAVDSATLPSNSATKPADDLAACVQAAGTDVTKLQACSS
jgi:hypothetical protein